MSTEIATVADSTVPIEAGFQSAQGFELIQRMAKMLASSALVPKEFQNNVPNCVIALEMARRMNASPLAVCQAMYIVYGKPSWSSQFVIACINSTGKFSPLRFRMTGTEAKDDRTCVAWATEKATGEVLESPPVSIGMARAEGWFTKNGSKWQTMPELMLRYRAATLFGRLYAPEVLMGMRTEDEAIDVTPEPAPANDGRSRSEALAERLKGSNGGNGNGATEHVDMTTGEITEDEETNPQDASDAEKEETPTSHPSITPKQSRKPRGDQGDLLP